MSPHPKVFKAGPEQTKFSHGNEPKKAVSQVRASVVFLVVMLFLPYTQQLRIADNTGYFPSPPYQVEPNTSTSPVDYAWSNMISRMSRKTISIYQKYDVDAEGTVFWVNLTITYPVIPRWCRSGPRYLLAKLNHIYDWVGPKHCWRQSLRR